MFAGSSFPIELSPESCTAKQGRVTLPGGGPANLAGKQPSGPPVHRHIRRSHKTAGISKRAHKMSQYHAERSLGRRCNAATCRKGMGPSWWGSIALLACTQMTTVRTGRRGPLCACGGQTELRKLKETSFFGAGPWTRFATLRPVIHATLRVFLGVDAG